MKCERSIVRKRPGRGGPDDGADVVANFRGITFAPADDAKFHPDGRAGVIFVFNFGFGERGAVVNGPVDGLAAAVYVTFFYEVEKSAGDSGLIIVAHRQIGIVPAAEHAKALEILLVLLDEARRKFPAQLAELRRRHFL